MKTIVIIFMIYILLLNILTTYRIYKDELYEPWQKAVQFLLIWCVPLIGALLIASMLNRTSFSEIKLPNYLGWLGGIFFLSDHSTQKGYPSSMNDNGDLTGGVEPGCYMSADSGGCGGE